MTAGSCQPVIQPFQIRTARHSRELPGFCRRQASGVALPGWGPPGQPDNSNFGRSKPDCPSGMRA